MNTETLNKSTEKKNQPSFSWYFFNEEEWCEEIENFPGDYDEEYGVESDFFDKIDEIINLHLGNALNRLDAVLEKFPIHHVSVCVDLMGMDKTDAFCLNSGDFEETGRNNIGLGIGPGMVRSFLERHFYPNAYAEPYHELNFDHELIHGMDQNLWTYSPKGISPETPKEHLLAYLLKYQTEGLACFSTFLRGHLGEKSFRKAASKFEKNLNVISSFKEQNPENWITLLNKLDSHGNDPYRIGSMMVLQAIKVKASENNNFSTLNLLEKAMNIEYLNNDEINDLIIEGLHLSFPEFVNGLYKADLNGATFIPKDNLFAAFEHVNSWTNYLTEEEKKKNFKKPSITELEMELASIKDLEDEFIDLRKCEIDYNIKTQKDYQKYQSKCEDFYEQVFKGEL